MPQEKATVAILDNDSLVPLWEPLEIMDVDVSETSRATKYTVEDGTTRSDHVVVNPVEISITAAMVEDLAQSFGALRQAYKDQALVTVQTRAGVYPDMLIEEIPHDENPGKSNAIGLKIKLSEWRESKPEHVMLSPVQRDTVNRGSQGAEEVPPKKQSVLKSLFSWGEEGES